MKEQDNRTGAQKESLLLLLKYLKNVFPKAVVHGHKIFLLNFVQALMQPQNIKIYNMKEILDKLFGRKTGGVADKLTGVVDKFIRTKDEKAAFEKEMTEIFIQR